MMFSPTVLWFEVLFLVQAFVATYEAYYRFYEP